MTDLSAAAQAVLDAYDISSDGYYDDGVWIPDIRKQLAAALRAAADQVVPEQALEDVPGRFVNVCCHSQRQNTRAELLAIATELETSTTENR